MSDDNTQDGAEPSLASAGSHPFWAWWSPNFGIGYFADIKSRAIAYRDAGCGEIFPIYRQPQPTLTDEERESLRRMLPTIMYEPHRVAVESILQRLG